MLLLRLGVLFWSLLGFSLPCFAVDSELAALERQVHDLVNVHRQTRGLSPLAYNEEIASIARRHSQDMATGRAGVGHQQELDKLRARHERQKSNSMPWLHRSLKVKIALVFS
jgi:uncharacterized protein YkwD